MLSQLYEEHTYKTQAVVFQNIFQWIHILLILFRNVILTINAHGYVQFSVPCSYNVQLAFRLFTFFTKNIRI